MSRFKPCAGSEECEVITDFINNKLLKLDKKLKIKHDAHHHYIVDVGYGYQYELSSEDGVPISAGCRQFAEEGCEGMPSLEFAKSILKEINVVVEIAEEQDKHKKIIEWIASEASIKIANWHQGRNGIVGSIKDGGAMKISGAKLLYSNNVGDHSFQLADPNIIDSFKKKLLNPTSKEKLKRLSNLIKTMQDEKLDELLKLAKKLKEE